MYVYYFTRGFIASTRAFNLLTRVFNHPNCAFNLATRAFSLVTRGFKLVTRKFKLLTREFEIVTRGFELVTRVALFHFLSITKSFPLEAEQTHVFFWSISVALFVMCIRNMMRRGMRMIFLL